MNTPWPRSPPTPDHTSATANNSTNPVDTTSALTTSPITPTPPSKPAYHQIEEKGTSLTSKRNDIPATTTATPRAPSKQTKWRYNSTIVAAIIAGIAGIAAAITSATITAFSHSSGNQPPQQAVQPDTPTFSNSINPGTIKITQVYDQVPRCATFGGEGNVPVNKNLWLAIFPNNTQKYFFRPATVNAAQHSWIATNVTIGSKDSPIDSRFTIYAVLADNETDQQLRQGHFAGGITTLPPNLHKVDQIEIRRGSDSAECK